LLQATTQWRKVQERLEDDERCSRLEKIDRLDIFQVGVLTMSIFHHHGSSSNIHFFIAGVYSASGERRGRTEADTKGTTFSYLCNVLFL
jgi:hypothetical protein